MRTWAPILFLVFAPVGAACGDSSGGDGTGAADDAFTPEDAVEGEADADPGPGDDEPAPTTVAGRVVDLEGAPVIGVKVLACTPDTCVTNTTSSDGTYESDVPGDEPRKMQVLGSQFGLATLNFYQPVVVGETVWAATDITLPPKADPLVAWPAADGGTALVAEDALELAAAAGVLTYPLGTLVEQVGASPMPVALLPPYDSEPWAGVSDGAVAFVFEPFELHASEPVGLRLLSGVEAEPGAIFDLWTIDGFHGTVTSAGTATADLDGVLVSDTGSGPMELTTLVIAPRGAD